MSSEAKSGIEIDGFMEGQDKWGWGLHFLSGWNGRKAQRLEGKEDSIPTGDLLERVND